MTDQARFTTDKAAVGLALAALGVVFGDIATSPLYALRESFGGAIGVSLTRSNLLGVLSLVFWALNFVVSFKYITLVMRADNRGEGGILALLALVRPGGQAKSAGRRSILLMVGVFGAALLYGDGVITPAITVLGAVDGLKIASPIFATLLVPISVIILSLLFVVQKYGTAGIGRVFGPVMALWLAAIAVLGVGGIVHHPEVLAALNPWYAVQYFANNGVAGLGVLAAVVLVITGGEALYADMGHFGPRPIRLGWFSVVLPALVLNYFGQGALLLDRLHPGMLAPDFNPFYELVPGWALYPMIILATAAAVVASQSLISGAYSLTQQAMQLGFAPRMRIIHTSHTEMGQIYMPAVNAALWVGCVALVVSFGTPTALASAYGVAVTGTMLTTSILFAAVMRNLWHWPLWRVVPITVVFVAVDIALLLSNLTKIPHGGWFPITAAIGIYLLMSTWKRGRHQVTALLRETSLPLDLFVADMVRKQPQRVPGIAVFMTSIPDVAPPVLLHHLKHIKVLHEKVILMTILAVEIPQVPTDNRVAVVDKGGGFYQVTARYGFLETPRVTEILERISGQLGEVREPGTPGLKMSEISFFLGRETLIVSPRQLGLSRTRTGMPAWRARLFGVMTRNAQSATAYFGLPPNRVIELGAQIQI